jgi:hypothetical protein
MKWQRVILASMIFVAIPVEAKKPEQERPFCLMKRPMVTGAGFSSGIDGKSFIHPLAEFYGTQDKIIQEAYPGNEGKVVVQYPSFRRNVKKASIVLALDFFYWDQAGCRDPEMKKKNEQAIDALFGSTVEKGIPLVVAKLVPRQSYFYHLRAENDCLEALNVKLKARCDPEPEKCLLIDPSEITRRIERTFEPKLKALDEKERNLFIRAKITRDGIHPRTEAYEVIAKYMEEALRLSRLQCR